MWDYLDKFINSLKFEGGLSDATVSAYFSDLKEFVDFLIVHRVDRLVKLDQKVIRKYLEKLYLKNLSRNSYLRKLSSLNGFMDFLVSERDLDQNPMINIKRPIYAKKLPKHLTSDELRAMLMVAKEDLSEVGVRMNCVLNLLVSGGLRISEAVGLKMFQIRSIKDGQVGFIVVMGKGNKERSIPVNPECSRSLSEYLKIRPIFIKNQPGVKSDFVFPANNISGHLRRESFGLWLKNLAILSHIDPSRISPHVLRHSFATNLCNKKVNLRFIQELLGHSDISTTEIYIDVDQRDVVDFVNNFHPLNQQK